MGIRAYKVDAFTERPFSGNPAAVCVLSREKDAGWMQDIAREMNLSETAFLTRLEKGFGLRWFTPKAEVELCGHATLAAAHILWEEGYIGKDETARFFTLSGLLTATLKGGWIEMDFPAVPEQAAPMPEGLEDALGFTPLYAGKNRFDYLVEAASEKAVRELRPDMAALSRITSTGSIRGLIVTARSETKGYDFVSRFFAPSVGIDEDPVTGSAHCCLGPFWKKRLNMDSFTALQVSRRCGEVMVTVMGERVLLAGRAVTIMRAELFE